ncbi:PAS domain-containing sensor histidine kinase [Azohydromonas lata]|uniref:PAS domain-containing sensor histidine kinase n=1 Tax=Azohydromonas lata TaxID=45677 RepID=UPI0012F480E7|nr:PAS domain-containing protein [Azohydromonas lata]
MAASDPSLASSCASPCATRAAQALALGVLALGGLVLLDGWLHLPAVRALQSAGPGLMKLAAAGCFAGAGLALLLSACALAAARRLAQVLGLLVAGAGAATLAGCVGDALQGRAAEAAGLLADTTGPGGRMLPATALGFVLCGLALAAGSGRLTGRRGAWAVAAAVAAALLALLAVFGCLVDVQAFYRLWPYAGMALHTALGLLALCAGWLLLHLGAGWLTRLSLVAATVAVVALLAMGWSAVVRLGVLELPQGAGLRALHTGAGLLVQETPRQAARTLAVGGALAVCTLLAVVLLLGREVARRRASEAALAAHRDELESTVAQRTAELARSEAHARQAAAVLEEVMENIPDPVWTKDALGRWTLLNSAAAAVIGLPREALQGLGNAQVLPAGHAAAADAEDERILRGGERIEVEERFFDAGRGEQRHFLSVKLPLRAADGRITGLLGVARDVTQRKRAESALLQSQLDLSRLTRRLMEQEQEGTRRLAQLLHDGLGQTLSALRLQLSALEAPDPLPLLSPAQRRAALAVRALVEQASAEVRGALVELRPALLEEQGLVAALEHDLRCRRAEAAGPALSLRVTPGLPSLRWPPQVEYAFFMVAREALHNAVLHAGATHIHCALEGERGWLRLQVRDDGCGVPDDPQRPGHLGVVGMRERAFAIGARYRLKGRPGQGSRMEIEWEDDRDDAHLSGG